MNSTEQIAQIRWLIRRDLIDVLRIEDASFEFPWTEEMFVDRLRQRNCIGMVAEREGIVLGYMIYSLHRNRLRLINLAVSPALRGIGIGAAMINKLKDKMASQRRNRLTCTVRESNLSAQLFLRSLGFIARRMEPSAYDDTDDAAIHFIYRAEWTVSGQDTGRIM